MSKRTRYLLIFFGFVIFAALAPTIAFFSAGLSYDWQNGHLVKTGILAFKTDPKNLNVTLNGERVDAGSGTLRFLNPKIYSLTFSQNSYCDWSKNLPVNAGQVTWASPFGSKVYLLKNSNTPLLLESGVDDFIFSANTLYTLKNNKMEILSLAGQKTKEVALPEKVDKLISLGDPRQFLAQSASSSTSSLVLINAETLAINNISGLVSKPRKVLRDGSGQAVVLAGGNLLAIDPLTKTTKKLADNVLDFTLVEGDVYAIQNIADEQIVNSFSLDSPSSSSTLVSLPNFSEAKIFVSSRKIIFVQGDSELYQVGLGLHSIGAASLVNFDSSASRLIYFGQNEASFFDFNLNQARLISRNADPLTNLILADNIGYALWQHGQNLEAVELDSRDRQNTCPLYKGSNIKKILPDAENHIVYILDGDELKAVEIR